MTQLVPCGKNAWQVVEKARQLRSRIAQRLNVRDEVRFAPSLAAALLGVRRVSARQGWAGEKSGLFEQPAGPRADRADVRMGAPPLSWPIYAVLFGHRS